MTTLLKNGLVYVENHMEETDILVDDEGGVILVYDQDIEEDMDEVVDCTGCHIFPGFIDPHTHLREPGQSQKETIETGTQAAARGGFTTIFAMPNLNPVPDSLAHLQEELNLISESAVIQVLPVASITQGQKGEGTLSDMGELSTETFLFSDDGVGVQDEFLMEEAMRKVRKCDGVILAHCEDNKEVPKGWSVHEGPKAKEYGLIGINNASEANEVIRDIALAKKTGCPLHLCHISCKESVEAIREGKKNHAPISAEVTPHHLCLNEEDIIENDGRFKMNPPLRSPEDQAALLEGLLDGTLDMIGTDHAPHTEAEKKTTLDHALNGVVGLEIAFPVLYTELVKTKKITLEKLIQLMSVTPAEVFQIPGGEIRNYEKANLCVYDLHDRYPIQSKDFVSKGKSTPFEGKFVSGRCVLTMANGQIVYRKEER